MSVDHEPVADPFIASAPGRVNLIGEHVDYNDGLVLPLAIERRVSIRVARRADRIATLATSGDPVVVTLDLAGPIRPRDRHWSNYPAGVIEGYRRRGYDLPGFDATISATLPAGGGLSSSAALEVAMATALEALAGRPLPPAERALLCQAAEHEFARVPCGIMDQFAVCFGRAGHALLLDCRSRRIESVPLDDAVRVLVFDSGVKHALADGTYASRRAACTAAARRLGVASLRDLTRDSLDGVAAALPAPERALVRHVVGEIARVPAFVAALFDRDFAAAGRLMDESHRSLADDYAVSCAELDRIVALARDIPAIYGCRLTGGGFGGCAVALVDACRAEAAGRALHDAYRAATGIDATWFVTAAAAGPQLESA